LKIYSDDPNLPYKTTKLNALYTKSEIDGLFAKWGVKDVYWHWALIGFAMDIWGESQREARKIENLSF
jgi:hypothetical protein